MATLPDLLKTLVDVNGSDLHLTAGSPPVIRVNGELRPVQGVLARGPHQRRAGQTGIAVNDKNAKGGSHGQQSGEPVWQPNPLFVRSSAGVAA